MCRVACGCPQLAANEQGASLLLHQVLGATPPFGILQSL